jgi:hypothetical protein
MGSSSLRVAELGAGHRVRQEAVHLVAAVRKNLGQHQQLFGQSSRVEVDTVLVCLAPGEDRGEGCAGLAGLGLMSFEHDGLLSETLERGRER